MSANKSSRRQFIGNSVKATVAASAVLCTTGSLLQSCTPGKKISTEQ